MSFLYITQVKYSSHEEEYKGENFEVVIFYVTRFQCFAFYWNPRSINFSILKPIKSFQKEAYKLNNKSLITKDRKNKEKYEKRVKKKKRSETRFAYTSVKKIK